MPDSLIARAPERKLLSEMFEADDPALVAIWGRRRIGKTFLIRHSRPKTAHYFELTGVKDGPREQQLFNFAQSVSKAFYNGAPVVPTPADWSRALTLLSQTVEAQAQEKGKGKEPVVLFFDEAPWLDSRKSGFLNALEYFWNAWGSAQPRVKLIVCGSSSSWILKKIVKGRGGWHRRVTHRIHLHPFTLLESKQYLESKGIKFAAADLIELYMALGGVAQYLKEVKRGESVSACLNRLCFQRNGMLRDEFDELFHSLFNAAELHIRIVTALASSRSGLTKSQLRTQTKIPPGRQFSQCLENLCNADFVASYQPFGQQGKRYATYRLSDFFSLFHLKWMRTAQRKVAQWQMIHDSPAYRSWAGFTFEMLVWNHIEGLLGAVGLQHTPVETTQWRHRPSDPNETGAQIDLLINADKAGLYILELKHYDKPYQITKADNKALLEKRQALERATQGRRSIFIHLLASAGVMRNTYALETVDYIHDVQSLFYGGPPTMTS